MTTKEAVPMAQDLAHRFQGHLASTFDLLHAQKERDEADEFNAGLLFFLLILFAIEAAVVYGMQAQVNGGRA